MTTSTQPAAGQPAPKKISVPGVLRRLGVVILVAAGATFMFEGWHTLTSLEKYAYFLAFTFALTLLGVFCARRLEDDKGARTFLGLATATLPVHFSQLGAMIYSLFADARAGMPHLFVYQASSPLSVAVLTAIGIFCVVPIAYVGFAAFCRSQAFRLSLVHVATSSLLLLPTRDAAPVACLIAIAAGVLMLADRHWFHGDLRMKTPEGSIARALLVLPTLVLVGRAVLYPTTDVLEGTLWMTVASLLFFQMPRYLAPEGGATLCQRAAIPLFGWGFVEIADRLVRTAGVPHPYDRFLVLLPLASLYYAISFRAVKNEWRLRALAGYLAFLTCLFNLSSGHLATSIIAIAVGVALVADGFTMKERHPVVAGALTFVLGLMVHLEAALRFCTQSPWVSLAVLGVAICLAASYLERYSTAILGRVRAARQRLTEWR